MFRTALRCSYLGLAFVSVAVAAEKKVDFNRDVRPILSDNCFACHGFDAKKRKADLRLDTSEGATALIDSRQAIKPGDVAGSTLIQRILTNDADELMPPPETHKKITPAQLAILKQWIQEGAPYQKHWSFELPRKPEIPKSAYPDKVRNAVDAFIHAKLAQLSAEPAPEASREQLIRRVTLDLTGLPPTLEEVDAFLNDESPDAYEKLVDRLLMSERYGEHMARFWLDLARYADTHGLHLDNERSMWPYRDWVVKAFNENLNYADFTRWQLAGDLFPNASIEQQVASGFNRCNVTTSEGGSINEEFIFRYAVDRTDTTVAVWMGLTAGCAVCHDHKYDPITQKDFYSLYAFFNSAADPAMDGNILLTPPILRLATEPQKLALKKLEERIQEKQSQIKTQLTELAYEDPAEMKTAPPLMTSEEVWFEDSFPAGADLGSSGEPTQFIAKTEGPVFSGSKSLKRKAKGVAQDFFSKGARLDVLPNGKLSVYCYLDPKDPPRAVMLQFHVGGWNHRAVWGEEGAIPFGKVRTPERVLVGRLPELGKWVNLEVAAEKLGLKSGMKVSGFAFTQFDGTVYWDKLVMRSRVDPAKDPQWSWKVWKESKQGTRVEGLPNDLMTLVRGKKAIEWPAPEREKLRLWWLENEYQGARDRVADLRAEKLTFEGQKKAIEELVPATFVMADLPDKRESFIMKRGQYDQPAEKVIPATPAVFAPLPQKIGQPNRLDLAEWLLLKDNPLTARVQVNRFWQQFFGVGLVKTSNDFGSQGEAPSHPELLDWLAVHFRESGWDMKGMVRLLVTSHTYRQSARVSEGLLAKDPENRWHARGARFRLDAESVRDGALAVSGLLNYKMGGKGVKPYQPENIWEPVAFGGSNTKIYTQDHGDSLYRRSLYTFWKRTAPPPSMTTFDAPNRESYCLRRERSNTPLQALNLLNDVQYIEAGRHLAQHLLQRYSTYDERITAAFRLVTSRFPSAQEVEIMRTLLDRHLADFRSRKEDASKLLSFGESKPEAKILPEEWAAWTLIANLLLNLDEVVTRG